MLIIHASSTIESGAPQIYCLALFVYPVPSNLIRSPMKCLSFMHPPPSSLEPHEEIRFGSTMPSWFPTSKLAGGGTPKRLMDKHNVTFCNFKKLYGWA